MQHQSEELAIMMDIGKAITSSLDLEEVLQVIMGKISTLLKPGFWSLCLLDDETGDLYIEDAVALDGQSLKGKRFALGEGASGWVASHGESLLLTDPERDMGLLGGAGFNPFILKEFTSLLSVPLSFKGQIFGAMEIANSRERKKYTEADKAILEAISDFAAIAIANARTYARVNAMVITDDLTGLYNARHFNKLLELEVDRALRYVLPLSFVFFDLDHFKMVNDKHGHLVGSRILAEVGQLLKKNIRAVDIAARFGGDEFVVLLPNTEPAGACIMVEHFRDKLRVNQFLSDDGKPITVTASFGIAGIPDHAATKLALVRLADKAMYQVKGTTRDGVMVADGFTECDVN